MAKKSSSTPQLNPAIRLSNLHPRLTQLFTGDHADTDVLEQELTRLTSGLKPATFLPILLNAFHAAPDERRTQYQAIVGAWLTAQQHDAALRDLVQRKIIYGSGAQVAQALLGEETALTSPEQEDLFAAASTIGNASQAAVAFFWYADERRRTVHAGSFLIDFEPPWNGALKDVMYRSFRSLDAAQDSYYAIWRRQGMEPTQINQAQLSERLWQAIRCSQAEQIRLPADYTRDAKQLTPFLLSLPATPIAPPLSAEELEHLRTHGRTPEALTLEEQRMGYQMRMSNGEVIRILRDGDIDDV